MLRNLRTGVERLSLIWDKVCKAGECMGMFRTLKRQAAIWILFYIQVAGVAQASNLDALYDNASMGSPLLGMIQNARKSIDIEIYQMQDTEILSSLKAAADRRVRIRVIQEANTVASPCHVFDPVSSADSVSCVRQKEFVVYVRNHGGTYVPFSAELCGTPGSHCFQHGKLVIVDGNQAMLSTGNFNASSLCDRKDNPTTCNRDYSLLTKEASVIAGMQRTFDSDLLSKTYNLPVILASVKENRLTVSPFSTNPLVEFIRSARKSIQIENQYMKDPELNEALMAASRKGVKVFLMVSSACSFGRWREPKDHTKIVNWTNLFTQFEAAGIFTKIFTEKISVNNMPGYLHAKAILVDGAKAWVGSVNGSTLSLNQNREFGLFTSETQPAQLLATLLYQDFMSRDAETWKESLECKKDYGNADPTENSPPGDEPM